MSLLGSRVSTFFNHSNSVENTKMLLHKLDKMNVTLNEDGSVDYSKVPFPYIRQSLEKMDRLVRIALMERDLKFEYPHLTEKLKIKGEMLKIINAEEAKLQKMKIQKELFSKFN